LFRHDFILDFVDHGISVLGCAEEPENKSAHPTRLTRFFRRLF
jgi:hypothetical protein